MSPRKSKDANHAPDPEDPRKPDEIRDIKKRSWFYVLKKTMREFSKDQCTDSAAALTYYGVLALFPALIAHERLLRHSQDSHRPNR